MTDAKRKQWIEQPEASTDPEIGRLLWMFQFSRQRTNDLLDQVDPASLDWQPEWCLNSIGTLLYHIALIELDWLQVEVLEQPEEQHYPGELAALFPYPARSNNALTRVTGVTLAEHRQRLDTVRRTLLDAFRDMTLDDFRRVRHQPETDVSPEWVLFYLSQHEAEHRSEIAALQTQFRLKSEPSL